MVITASVLIAAFNCTVHVAFGTAGVMGTPLTVREFGHKFNLGQIICVAEINGTMA